MKLRTHLVSRALKVPGIGSDDDNPVPGFVVDVLRDCLGAGLGVGDNFAARLVAIERGRILENVRQPQGFGVLGQTGGLDDRLPAIRLAIVAIVDGYGTMLSAAGCMDEGVAKRLHGLLLDRDAEHADNPALGIENGLVGRDVPVGHNKSAAAIGLPARALS